jgi:hypothetical protein
MLPPLVAGCALGALLLGAVPSSAKPTPHKTTEDAAVVPGAYMIEFTDDHASFYLLPVLKRALC